jgi:hypothetical protein
MSWAHLLHVLCPSASVSPEQVANPALLLLFTVSAQPENFFVNICLSQSLPATVMSQPEASSSPDQNSDDQSHQCNKDSEDSDSSGYQVKLKRVNRKR